MAGNLNVAILFYHDDPPIADALYEAMAGETWHMVSFTGLTEGERNVLRDVLYAAAESVGYNTRLPDVLYVEQERDDPSVYHIVPQGVSDELCE